MGGEFPLYLDVPYAEKETVKVAGGRWDAERKQWYIPPRRRGSKLDLGTLVEYLSDSAFAPCEVGAGAPMLVWGLDYECFKCHGMTRAIAGIECDRRSGWADELPGIVLCTSEIGLRVATLMLGPSVPAGVGEVKPRTSKTAGSRYLSNGCVHCDAIVGAFFLGDAITDALLMDRAGMRVLGTSQLHPAVASVIGGHGWTSA